MRIILFAALAFAAPIAAFVPAPADAQGRDPELGATVRADIVAQVIDMHPHYAGIPAAGSDGRRAADAMIRYELGKQKPLLKTNGKTDVGGQGGAGDAPTVSIPLISSSPN